MSSFAYTPGSISSTYLQQYFHGEHIMFHLSVDWQREDAVGVNNALANILNNE
jgi:hypothetical protein